MNETPFPSAGHGIRVGPAQKPETTGGKQIVNRNRIAAELPVEESNRPGVFIAPKDKFFLPLALSFLIDAGQGCGQGNQHERGDHQQDHQRVTLFVPVQACLITG